MAIVSRRGMQNVPPPPKAKVTAGKTTLLVSFALLFDAVKFMCTQLWFFGPAIVSLAGSAALGGGWFGAAVGTVIGVAAAASVGAAIEALGVILALIVGIIGWMVMLTLMIGTGIRPFHSRNFLTIVIGFLISEMPFIDALPSLTVSTWRIIAGERKADKEAKQKWEAENAAAYKQQQRMELAAQRQMQEMQAANDNEAAQEESDAADAEEEERSLQEQYDALGFQDTEAVAAQLASENPAPSHKPLLNAPAL